MGSEKQSIESRRKWDKLTPAEKQRRVDMLQAARKAAWDKTSPEQRKRHASIMAKARWGTKITDEVVCQ